MPTDYDQLAARYDEDRARWSFPPDDVVAELRQRGEPATVLDLGCGTGRWQAAQQDLSTESLLTFVGADPSTAMLAVARRKGLRGLVRARAEDLPLMDGSVTYVASSYAFHHFTDKERALDEVDRVLVGDSGILRINNLDPGAAAGWWLYEFFPETVAIDAARFWPVDRIREALVARGLAVAVELDSGTSRIPATQALEEAERRVLSQLALLDDRSYASGLARLREVAGVGDATVTTCRSRLQVTARRR